MAGSASGIRAGKAYYEMFIDNNPLSRGLKASAAQVKAWGKGVASVGTKILSAGAIGVTGLLGLSKVATDVGGQLIDFSAKSGASVEALSALKFAADQNGTSLEAVGNGITKMQKTLAEAAGGSDKAREALAGIGMTIEDLAGMSPEEQFLAISDGISKIQNPAERTKAAMDIFGKSGANLLPLLNLGKNGIQGFMDEAKAAGLVVSGETAQSLDDLGDKAGKLFAVLKAGAVQAIGALAPTLTTITNAVVNVASAMTNWIAQHRGVVIAVAAGIAVVTALGVAILGLGAILSAIGTIISVVGTVFGALVAVVGAILSPIGLLVAGVAALGAYFLSTSDIVSSAVEGINNAIAGLGVDFGAVFAAMRDALMAGDISAAAEILWATLQLLWTQGVNYLTAKWMEWKNFAIDVWQAMITGIARIIVTGVALIESVWDGVTSWIGDKWKQLTNALTNLWNGFVDTLKSAAIRILEAIKPLLKVFNLDVDTETMRKELEKAAAARDSANEQAHREELARRKAEQDQRAKDRDKLTNDTLKTLDEDFQRGHDARQKALDEARKAGLDAANQRVLDARGNLQTALDRMKKTDPKKQTEPKPGMSQKELEIAATAKETKKQEALAKEAARFSKAMGTAERELSGSRGGTFSAAAVGSLGGLNFKDIEKELEEHTEVLRRIESNTREDSEPEYG